MKSTGALEALAQALANKVRRNSGGTARLQIVQSAPSPIFDGVTRESILRRVRFLARSYGLQFLVDQATFNAPSLECLADPALSQLLSELESTREALAAGVAIEDLELMRDTSRML